MIEDPSARGDAGRDAPAPLGLLFVDAELLAVAKPARLPVHAHARFGAQDGDTVLARLAAQGYPKLFTVHRLDAATSGALLFARTIEAARAVGQAFEAGRVGKRYLALVRGEFPEGRVVVDHPVPRDEGGPRVPAQTCFERLAVTTVADSALRERRYSWIAAEPRTGRFHQIRRHAKHLGHPLVGDTNYGRSEHNAFVRARTGLDRLALHAERLSLELPGRSLEVVAPLCEDLACACARLGLALR